MATSGFAQRHGYQAERPVFEKPGHLPEDVRRRVGRMMVEHFESLPLPRELAQWRFAYVIRDSLIYSRALGDWYDALPDAFEHPNGSMFRHETIYDKLIKPLMDCDWRLFYTVVENSYTELEDTGRAPESDFAPELNLVLASSGIPWILESGWVIPADDHAFVDELKYVRQVGQSRNAEDLSDPLVSLRNAFDALYRKRGGPDITGACNHAWVAWETAREAAGGVEVVRRARPELWRSLTEWRDLIHAGRHPGKKLGRPPTEAETGFIVRLCADAVRLVSTSLGTDENF